MTRHRKVKYLIIGAGPTGLGAAYRLKELNINDFLIVEQSDYIGGLATTFVDPKNFLWDVGGHVQFSHYTYFDNLMMKVLGPEGWLNHDRESWVWLRNSFIPYPFQNNIHLLPKETFWKCINGIIELNKNNPAPVSDFNDWILRSFGNGIAEEFMIPYNYKVWAYPANEMNYSWIGERVATVDLGRIVKNAIFDINDVGWGPNNTFQFPKQGGTGNIWKTLGEKFVGKEFILLNSKVTEVNASEKKVRVNNEDIYYDHLISTMPIDLLCKSITDAPEQLKDKSSELKYSSTNIVGIGLKGKPSETIDKKCWMYFPEKNSPYYRVTVFSNYSPFNVPDINKYWSLMTETSESSHKPVNHDKLAEDTINALYDDKLIASKDLVESVFQIRFEYGYPTPGLKRDHALKEINPWLEAHHIYSRGRFGAWKYEVSNQDHSLMQGVELINFLQLDIPETTIRFPGTANAMWGKY